MVIQGVCMIRSSSYLRKSGEAWCTGKQEM
jgi:hypothetical protein